MVMRQPFVVALTLVAALTATGCAGKLLLNSAQMCQAHGGTYNASTKNLHLPALDEDRQADVRGARWLLRAHPGRLRNRARLAATS
jgi:hypothetical protein